MTDTLQKYEVFIFNPFRADQNLLDNHRIFDGKDWIKRVRIRG